MKSLFTFLLFATAVMLQAQTLSSVESVEYDAVNQRWLASNGSNVVVVNGSGTPVGYFGTEPKADYGMEVMNGVLYCVVGSSVRGYQLSDGAEIFSVTVPGATFLNGMASDGNNRLWVTDFSAKKVIEINTANNEVMTVVNNTTTTPNGIVYDEANNRLVFVNWGSNAKIKSISLSDYAVTTLANTALGNLDGIDNDLNGQFYVSSWNPTRITRFTNEFTEELIITAPGIASPADICYAEEADTLAIPNSGNNSITFVSFTGTAIDESAHSGSQLRVYPNPVSEGSAIEFDIRQSQRVRLVLTTAEGKMVHELLNEVVPACRHKVLLNGLNVPAGFYHCTLYTAGSVDTVSFTKY